MAPPAASQPSSKSTADDATSHTPMEGDDVRLTPPMLAEGRPVTESDHESEQQTPKVERRSILFDMQNTPSRRSRATSIEEKHSSSTPPIVVSSKTIAGLVVDDSHLPHSVPTSPSPPHPKSRPKILNDLKRSLSHSNLHHMFHHKPPGTSHNNNHYRSPSATTCGTTSPLPDTPDLQSLFRSHPNKQACPNLPAVNRALQSLRSDSSAAVSHPEQTTEYLTSLTLLATTLAAARATSRKTLSQAMLARDAGRYEICRALCLSIVQEERHADIETRVYACAILSTLASKGMSVRFLVDGTRNIEEAWRERGNEKSSKEGEGGEGAMDAALRDKLLLVLALTKEGAVKRDGGMEVEAVRRWASEVKGLEDLRPRVGSEAVGDGSGRLKVPPESGENRHGTITPRSEKILLWQGWR